MQTISSPSIWIRFPAAVVLLLVGHAAVVAGAEPARELNVPPKGFTALFNGKDFTGWRVAPKIKAAWSIEDGVLKALKPVDEWIPDLETLGTYRNFVLLVDFRLPSASNSGVYIRGLVPVNVLGGREKIDINPGRMGHPLSFHYLTPDIRLADSEFPQAKEIRSAVGVWHTMKITLVGKTRWVIFGADAQYFIGSFDGKEFRPDHEKKHSVHHGQYYASQTFNQTLLAAQRRERREIRSYEADYVGPLWHLDFHHGSRKVVYHNSRQTRCLKFGCDC